MSTTATTPIQSYLAQQTLDNLMEGFQLIDYDWRYLYVNKAAVKQSKCKSADELLGQTMMEKFPGIEETEMFKQLEECMHTRKTACMQNKFEYPDGTAGWFELRIQPVPKGLFILSADITRQKQAEKELEKANQQLEEMVKDRTAELIDKNRELTDSITYAKRIQHSMLPSESKLTHHLPQSFVLYKPKDIVSGDFYWLHKSANGIFFAVADCTGHGVPGALVSVVCNNALNKAVKDYQITEPGKILDKVNELVGNQFKGKGVKQKVTDGMDIALCKLVGNQLEFAGAKNPLWIISDKELTEIKGDRQAIGEQGKYDAFTTHTLQLNKEDLIYLSTDGFPDQFGGPNGKKMKAKAMKKKLVLNSTKPLNWQKRFLDQCLETWKGDLEQVDDILVMAVKVG